MATRTFDFYTFLKDVTNPSLKPLQSNPRYDTIIESLAAMFSTLYERVQEIKIVNTLDINNDLTYQNHLNNNEGTISQDIILEYVSEYLNTTHFKATMAVLMRLYEYRSNNNQMNNLDKFVEKWIIPSFKFFTMNAGDLHKTKGTRRLLERLFEFYSEVGDDTKMFRELIEHDTDDVRDIRLNKFTSYRVGVDEVNLKRNYENISALDNITIHQFFELGKHKYVEASGFLFMSEKDREDWWIVDILDRFFKVDEDYYVVQRDDLIVLYSDDHVMYDDNHEFVPPRIHDREVNVEYIPQVMNVRDEQGEYHYGNFYWIEKLDNDVDTFADYTYNLKRWRNNGTSVVTQTVKENMGIGYEPLSFESNSGSYPRINSITSVDFLWLDFHDDGLDSYEFDIEDVKMVYTFTYEYEFKKPTGVGGFEYPKENMVAVTRDGYDYDHDANGFYYNILFNLNDDEKRYYQFLERVVSDQFDEELFKLVGSETVEIRTAFDVFVIEKNIKWIDDYYSFIGYWDAGNPDSSPPSNLQPSHGDYWIVSNDGTTELNGIKSWSVGDCAVWNGNFGYWEKNNEISSLVNGQKVEWAIHHNIIALGKDQFIA